MVEVESSFIPLEISLKIFKYLDGPNLGKCRRVNKQWKELIDGNDNLWYAVCNREFRCSSKVARRKSSKIFKWYHIYKNLRMWSMITKFKCIARSFYKFSYNDYYHNLEISDGVLPVKDAPGLIFYDTSTMRYIPVVIPEIECVQFANNDFATVMLLKSKWLIIRRPNRNKCESYYGVLDFILREDSLFYYSCKEIYYCDLSQLLLTPKLIVTCGSDLREMQFEDSVLCLFMSSGHIICYKNGEITVKLIELPVEWTRQIRNIYAIDERNFVCYSKHLFKIEADKYKHLYLEFPLLTALFFYGDDIVLIGTRLGKIGLYRLSRQEPGSWPIFETITYLPFGKFPVRIDVTERKSGPLIVVWTCLELYTIEVNFFPHEEPVKTSIGPDKIPLLKRLLKIRDKFTKKYERNEPFVQFIG